jgi:isopentenyl-diphosphate delta-isomerase
LHFGEIKSIENQMKNIQRKGNEYVVLVTSNNKVIGTALKLETHNQNTPLHRGFSLFLFNKKGELLLQQRSKKKKTWPLIWSNSCCGHPLLNESNTDAARRRLKFELGIKQSTIFEVLPDFSYRVEKDGVVENEICPVLIGFSDQEPQINKDEVESIKWIPWQKLINDLKDHRTKYSPWCILEANLLDVNLFRLGYK